MREEITEKEIDETLESFKYYLKEQIKKKGNGAFVSEHEMLGATTEEYLELAEAVHKKDKISIRYETLDLAVAAFWGFASLYTNKMKCKSRN